MQLPKVVNPPAPSEWKLTLIPVAFPGRSDSHDEENGGEEGQDDSIEKLDMTGSPGGQGKLEEECRGNEEDAAGEEDGDLEEDKVAEKDDEEDENDQEDDEEATLDLLAPVVTNPNRRTANASPTKRTIANPALTKKASSPIVPKRKTAHEKNDSTDSGFKDIYPSKRRK
jgi:hypothetical protein